MTDHFTLRVGLKDYLRVYLELNCGNPVDLSVFPDLYLEFRQMLSKPPKIQQPDRPGCYRIFEDPSCVYIIIPNDWFYRYGYYISPHNRQKLKLLIEAKLKLQLMLYVEIRLLFDETVASSIRSFQNDYGTTEDVWPYDSIKKHIYRHINRELLNKSKAFWESSQASLSDDIWESFKSLNSKIYARSRRNL